MVWTLAAFLAIAVHVIPTQFPDNVLQLAEISSETEPHIEIRTALVDMAIRTMIAPFTFLLDKVQTDFKVMTEIAPFAIGTKAIILKFLASFNFGFIMGMYTAITLFAFTVDEFLAHSVCCQLRIVT